MSTVTQEVIAALRGRAGLQALVGNGDSPETYRIYSLAAKQNDDYPLIVVSKLSQTRELTLSSAGGQGVENQRCRVDIYAETLSACEAVAAQARLALINYQSADFKVVGPVLNLDLYESDTKLYHVVNDYSVWVRH